MWMSGMVRPWNSVVMAAAAIVLFAATPARAQSFPYDQEMLLETKPLPGSRRVPMMEIHPDGRASVDLWCHSAQAEVPLVRAIPHHLGARRPGRGPPAPIGGCGLQGCDGQAADAQAYPRASRRGGEAVAASLGALAAQAALRASGRKQSADRRGPRHGPRGRARELPTLSRSRFPEGISPRRHAIADRVSKREEPFRR